MPEADKFGLKRCDVEGYEHVWVELKTRGYPRKLRKEWDGADSNATLGIVLRYIAAWNMTDVEGAAVENTQDWTCLENVEDAVATWLVRVFVVFWLRELIVPRPNSLPPSPVT